MWRVDAERFLCLFKMLLAFLKSVAWLRNGPFCAAGEPRVAASNCSGSEGGARHLALQVFEPRRFVELRKQSFWKQVHSGESVGMGLFYTLNVFFIQFYLGVPSPGPDCPMR